MKVSILKQENYELNSLKETIKESLENIIDLPKIFNNNKTVLLKVNAVSSAKADLAYSTNPEFVRAVIQILKEYPVKIIVGDNPPFKDLKSTLKGNGILEVINSENVELLKNDELITIKNSNPLKYSEFDVSKNIINADIIINLPKLKTHSLTYLSCAEKNYFGLIHGLTKAKWHVRADNPKDFGLMINDLYLSLKEEFKEKIIINLVDGIDILEGDGPTSGGQKTHLGCVICSTSAVAADVVALNACNLELSKSFITTTALENNIEISSPDDIELIGSFKTDKTIKVPEKTLKSLRILEKQFMKNILLEHPIIDPNKCIKCGSCAKICPPQTMKIEKGKFPHLNPNKCIRCWCCSEVCPQDAISKSKRPILGRIFIK